MLQRAGGVAGRDDAASLRRAAGLRRGRARARSTRASTVNQRKGGDHASALLVATVNGQFDLGAMLLDRGANPNLTAENGVAPLYAAINLMWAPRAGYPQPRAQVNQKLSYLEYLKRLLDAGADPNQRVNKKVWYSNFNFDQSGVDEAGATPFWRAAYGADVDAMKLLVSYGADPAIPTIKPVAASGDRRRRPARDARRLRPAADPGRRPRRAAAARRRRRRLRRRLRRQLPSSRARRHAGGGDVSRSTSSAPTSTRAITREHRRPPRRVARRSPT